MVYLSFMSKALKYEVCEIGFNAFIDKVSTEHVRQVYVIDR